MYVFYNILIIRPFFNLLLELDYSNKYNEMQSYLTKLQMATFITFYSIF